MLKGRIEKEREKSKVLQNDMDQIKLEFNSKNQVLQQKDETIEQLEDELENMKTELLEKNERLENHEERSKQMKREANENLNMCDSTKVNNTYLVCVVCLTKE